MKFHWNPQNNVLGNIMVAKFRNFVESPLKCEGWGVWGLFLFFSLQSLSSGIMWKHENVRFPVLILEDN